MTDPIEEIVDEMNRAGENYASKHPYSEVWRDSKVNTLGDLLDWAARLLAYWTPERRAFMEAAEAYGRCMVDDTRQVYQLEMVNFVSNYRTIVSNYRTMIAAEKA